MAKHGASAEYALSEKQLQLLWLECKDLRDKVLVGLLGYMGLRVGEAIHLRLGWIKDEEIHIPSSMPCRCWECYKRGYWKPKSKASIRVIPIHSFLKPIFLEYFKSHPEGLQLTRQACWYRIQSLASRAKLPKTFPHSLRATAATTLASKGFTAVELCVYMGWARLNMGEHYIRMSEARIGAKNKLKAIYG